MPVPITSVIEELRRTLTAVSYEQQEQLAAEIQKANRIFCRRSRPKRHDGTVLCHAAYAHGHNSLYGWRGSHPQHRSR